MTIEVRAAAVNPFDVKLARGVIGGYATAVTVPATSVLAKPPGLPWSEAASLLMTGVTAFHLLEATGVDAGDTVLVHAPPGASG